MSTTPVSPSFSSTIPCGRRRGGRRGRLPRRLLRHPRSYATDLRLFDVTPWRTGCDS